MRPETLFKKVADKRWFALLMLGASALLLILIALQLGRKFPNLASINDVSAANRTRVPVERIEQLSSKTPFLGIRPFVGTNHPFYTLYFRPPPPKPPAETAANATPPQPPPPPTKKVNMLYQGVYETAAGEKRAFIKVDEQQAIVNLGAVAVADLKVATIELRKLVLTNATGRTNILDFNHASQLEVPAK
jgi:hypothetical protein